MTNCTLWRFSVRQISKLARHQPRVLATLCASYLQVCWGTGLGVICLLPLLLVRSILSSLSWHLFSALTVSLPHYTCV